jgi:hypothetical protein
MKSDEKNQFSSNKNEFDPDMRNDKYEELKKDEHFQTSDKRNKNYTYDDTEEGYGKRVKHHDPHNESQKDLDRKNRNLNEPTNMDGWDLNREESPTTHELHRVNQEKHHHHYDQNAKTKQPDNNPSIEHTIHNPSKQQRFMNEVIHVKNTQFPENYNQHSSHNRHASNK